MNYVENDGGRSEAGFKGQCGDCGARAIAIACGLSYREAYQRVATKNKSFGFAKSARNGVMKEVMDAVFKDLGWVWCKAPKFAERKAYCGDLVGTVVARQAKHFVAVIDGVPHDIWDSSEKMVYGYWRKA